MLLSPASRLVEADRGQTGGEGERQQTGTLTTGLARAELALEEARELELRWPLCSEGCVHSPVGRRQAERKGQVSRDAWRIEAPSGAVS